jgi:hypothetical protein
MKFEKIFKKYNTSLVLILPIFKKIIQHVKNRYNQNYSIQGLFCQYGLINTYLYNTNGFNGTLKLLFDSNKLLDCKLKAQVQQPINNLLDLIINSEYFYSIVYREKHILIELKIPEEFLNDIKLIENSQYSKVSDKYKEYIKYVGSYILTEDDVLNYLYIENIPSKIIEKKKSLEDIIRKTFGLDTSISSEELEEYYSQFNKKKETYSNE